jgi:hypothetical protein
MDDIPTIHRSRNIPVAIDMLIAIQIIEPFAIRHSFISS